MNIALDENALATLAADSPNSSTIEIEKNIPIPSPSLPKYRYPFDRMEVDDSFSVPIKQLNSARTNMFFEHRKNSGKRFVSRTDGKIARFWRIK